MKKRLGQVWIETVLYTLIGLALIGIVLAFITPQINERKDRIAVEQAINSLNAFDERVNIAPGNLRTIEFGFKRGKFAIDGKKETVMFIMDDLGKPYSEPGVAIGVGRIDVLSVEGQKFSTVTLTLNYSGQFNITYDGKDDLKELSAAPVPYKFSIENKGSPFSGGPQIININEVSGR